MRNQVNPNFEVISIHSNTPQYIVEPTGKAWRVRRVWGPRKWFRLDNVVVRNNIASLDEAREIALAESVEDKLDPTRIRLSHLDPPF